MAQARVEIRRSTRYWQLGVLKVDLLLEGDPDGRRLHALPHRWFELDPPGPMRRSHRNFD